MSSKSFVFSSFNLPKAKARQFNKAFPFLSRSTAQEMTARALGYASWFDCVKRGTSGPPSLCDQEAGLDTRIARYYQQANVLISYGVTPLDADCWVRAWGLTGRPTMSLLGATPLFHRWDNALQALERGTIDEAYFLAMDGDLNEGYSKYPEVDRPARITPSVIVGPMGRYPAYGVNPALSAQIPIHLRGPIGAYHYTDHAALLGLYAPGFPAPKFGHLHERFNSIQYEWHFGRKHPKDAYALIPYLIEQARSNPGELVVITNRAMPAPGGADAIDFNRRAVACVSGSAFAEFLQSKGVINPTTVIWFGNVAPEDVPDFGAHEGYRLPVFQPAPKYRPYLPMYCYPFMEGPMADAEYMGTSEQLCLLPLGKDYSDDEGGFGGDDDSGEPDEPPLPNAPIMELA